MWNREAEKRREDDGDGGGHAIAFMIERRDTETERQCKRKNPSSVRAAGKNRSFKLELEDCQTWQLGQCCSAVRQPLVKSTKRD